MSCDCLAWVGYVRDAGSRPGLQKVLKEKGYVFFKSTYVESEWFNMFVII